MNGARILRLCWFAAAALAACNDDAAKGPGESKALRLPDLPIARCALAEGPVQVDRGTGRFEDVLVGEQLRSGDKLRTGPLGFARVDLVPIGGVRLPESAEIELQSVARTGTMRSVASVAITSGAVEGFLDPPAASTPLKPRLTLRAQTAPIIIELRGDKALQFRATVVKGGLEIAGLQGEAAVILNGTERPLRPAQYVDVIAGEVKEPRALPPPPDLLEPGRDERFFCPGLVARLAWRPVMGAVATQLQMARDPDFHGIVLSSEVASDHTLFVPRAPGRYMWRVASRDANGRLGDFSEARPLFCEAAPPEDLLVNPPDDAYVRSFDSPKLSFAWKPWPGAHSYRFVLAKGSLLSAPDAVTRSTRESSVEMEGLTEGAFVWGVWAEDAGDQPLFVTPHRLLITRSHVVTPSTLKHWGQ